MYLWGQRSPSNLGAMGFRPNQAVQRSVYQKRGMGDDPINVAVDPTMLVAGLGVLALASLLFAGRSAAGSVRKYQRRRIQRKRKKLQQQLAGLGF